MILEGDMDIPDAFLLEATHFIELVRTRCMLITVFTARFNLMMS
jgi:hypothetical protein